MKLKFDADLPYQHEAIKAAVDVFEGQPAAQTDYATAFQTFAPELFKEVGLSNPPAIGRERILENVQRVQDANDIPKTKTFAVKQGDDLYERANQPPRNTARPEYQHGFIITNIRAEPGFERIEFNNGCMIRLGQEEGGMAEDVMKAQIRETIERHLQKELKLKDKGVKVLSLIFIDRVANYRAYGSDGTLQKGRIALWFEQAFAELTAKPLYKGILPYPVESLHNGYFSQDKKGMVKDTRGNTKDDEDTYSLIMRDKERLLLPEEPLRFIFSHSALKEGWDNPNVFQLCSFREMGTERERRPIIGRGLRLSVNRDGERVYDDTINRLTVIAGESFEDYARGLQEDIERDCQIKFGRIEKTAFARLVRPASEGEEEKPIGQDASAKIWEDLQAGGYVDEKGDIRDKFDPAREGFILEIAPEHEPMKGAILDEMRMFEEEEIESYLDFPSFLRESPVKPAFHFIYRATVPPILAAKQTDEAV